MLQTHHAKPSPAELLEHNEKMISHACVELQKHLLESIMNDKEGVFGLNAVVHDSKIKNLQRTTKEKI